MTHRQVSKRIKTLRLKAGDILVIERDFMTDERWVKALSDAGKAAGIKCSVPIIFVDDINSLRVLRNG